MRMLPIVANVLWSVCLSSMSPTKMAERIRSIWGVDASRPKEPSFWRGLSSPMGNELLGHILGHAETYGHGQHAQHTQR